MDIKKAYKHSSEVLRSSKGRNILTFLIFLAISTVFWFLLAMNDDIQKDYSMPVTLEEFPENVTLISGINPMLNITVKDKASSLLKYNLGNDPRIKLRYDDFSRLNDSVLLMSQAQLSSAVRSTFGTSANIIGMSPDSLRLVYTSNPGIKVALYVDADIRTQPQYAYSGHPICDYDSVTIYSNSSDRFDILSLDTRRIDLANLTDTTVVEVPVETPPGIRAIPSTVHVTFPVEPLVSRQQKIPVEVVNLPPMRRLVTFPTVVEVSFLLPRSMYNVENLSVKAMVDYSMASPSVKLLPVKLSRLPSFVKSATVNPAQVEYVIEHVD